AADRSQERASWGLPYETNSAITYHLGRFLDRHRTEIKAFTGTDVPCPDWVLFNGGSLKADVLRQRIQDFLRLRFSQDSGAVALPNREMDLAVSLGAAYYGMVKSGVGVRVGSGSPRSYYVGVATETVQQAERPQQAVCLVERGLEEGSVIELPDQVVKVRANQPVSIDLFSSSFRSGDRSGDLVEVDDTLSALPALNTVIQLGEKGVRSEVPVRLTATYTEVGTLEIWCRSLTTPHRWRLRFQLRGATPADEVPDTYVYDTTLVEAARQVVRSAFAADRDPSCLPRLMPEIAGTLNASKDRWPLGLLRDLADTLFDEAAARHASAQAESRWMNLLGFCLRPGMGEGFDPQRINQVWKLYKKGPIHANAPQVRTEWWIMWRRVAAGLNPGQQRQFYQDTSAQLLPKKKSRISKQELIEIWMAAASMERLLVKDKIILGRHLVDRLKTRKPTQQLMWALSRIGARDLLYGSIDRVIPPSEVTVWIETLVSLKWRNLKPVVEMLSQLCRKTGDPLRDVATETRDRVSQWVTSAGDFPGHLERIAYHSPRKQNEINTVFGESLPAGLILEPGTQPSQSG
ncbi:MAG: molecular chaperone DnaK, partial [Desulfosarcina sp.]